MWPFTKKKEDKSYDGIADLVSRPSAAGVNVTHRNSLECSAVLACVRVLSNGIAQVPFNLFLEQKGVRRVASRHGLQQLVYSAPNDYQSSFEFWQMIMMHLTLTGNAYVWLNRGPDGRILEMLPYPPGSVSIRRDDWELRYLITLQDKRVIEVPRKDMWHIRWLAWDGVAGLDAVRAARDAIGLSMALNTHGATSFKNGSRLSGILTVAQRLDEKQRAALRESWEQTFGGASESGKVAVLGADMKWHQLSATNDVSQFDQSRRYQVEEICRAFGVDPVMVGYADKAATYASVEQKSIQHVVYTLGPWYSAIERSANRWLLTETERKTGYYFKFNVNALLRGAAADRAAFYTQMHAIGVLSPNEIRELEELNPYPGGDAYALQAQAGKEDARDEKNEGSVPSDRGGGVR